MRKGQNPGLYGDYGGWDKTCVRMKVRKNVRARELRGSRDGRPGLPVPNSHYSLCGRKATLNLNVFDTKNGLA